MAEAPSCNDSETDLLRKIILQSNTIFPSTTPQTPNCPESKRDLLMKWLNSLNGGT